MRRQFIFLIIALFILMFTFAVVTAPSKHIVESTLQPEPLSQVTTSPVTKGIASSSKILYGITLDEVTNLSDILTALSKHKVKPTTRIVFQYQENPEAYRNTVTSIYSVSYILGELVDSDDIHQLTVGQYVKRAQLYVETFKNEVDIWEIGNEINGEWTIRVPKGEKQKQEVSNKVEGAFDVIKTNHLKSAITLSYLPNKNCRTSDSEDMLWWAKNRLSEKVRNGVDYVFISWYEESCDPSYRPTAAEWNSVFSELHVIFPNSKLGFGEIGTQDPFGKSQKEREELINYYYGLTRKIKNTSFVGGYFWWYYKEEAVPWNKKDSLWQVLENAFNR